MGGAASLTSHLVAVAGVFSIGLAIGLLVLIRMEQSVLAVARAAARNVAGSFWMGVVVQLLGVPLLLLLLLACVLTIIGILVTPLVVLAWGLAYLGALTLGVMGVALMIGRALVGRGTGTSERSAALRGLTVGLLVLSLLWFGVALASPVPLVGVLARIVALSVSWAVATVGLGAVVTSRAGVAHFNLRVGQFRAGGWQAPQTAPTGSEVSPPSWATPTPLPGVIPAAKRPLDQ
jgi:hypothetical protein